MAGLPPPSWKLEVTEPMRHRNPYAGFARNGSSRRRFVRAFTMIEVVFSMFIFVLMAIMATVALTAANHSARYGDSYAQAMSIAQRKLDEMQEEGYGTLVATDFTGGCLLVSPNDIVDNNTWTSHGWSSTGAGAGYMQGTFNGTTTGDHLTNFFPSNVNGVIDVYPYGAGRTDNNGTYTTGMTMLRVLVTITWTDSNGQASSYSISTIVSSNVDSTF
jgi:type II secretory pathway pseudopilin PulG